MTALGTENGPAQESPPAPGRCAAPVRLSTAVRRLRTPRRPALLAELLLIGLTYWGYSLIRNAVPEQAGAAMRRGLELWRFQQEINIDTELWINHTINGIQWLVVPMNYFYAVMHFAVTGAVLVWLYLRHPGRYRPARTVLGLTTLLALIGYFLFPLAPPRLLPDQGFVDTVKVHETWGSLASGDLQELSNQYAAMPSMHAGWSLWCGIFIVMFARRRWVQALGVLYPLTTVVVILATANHFVLDAVGGWATLGAGFLIQWLIHGKPPHGFAREAPVLT